MKKNNNLGFMLTETLIVSSFISIVLIYLFVNFRKTYQYYDHSFTFNTVNGLYATSQIKKYLLDYDYEHKIKSKLTLNKQYLELSECPEELFDNPDYCKELFDVLEIKGVYFTYNDISNLAPVMKSADVDSKILTFLDYINYQPSEVGHRLIVLFNNETVATLKIKK